MKKKIFLPLIVIAILGTSCKLGSLVYYDDVYTTSSDAQYQKKAKTTQISENSSYQYDTQSQNYDSNYYTEEAENYNNSNEYSSEYSNNEYYAEEEQYYPETKSYSSGGNTYVTNNYYYDNDDYYDYYYTSRIRRFHSGYYTGWGYYDPYYTNLYWYDYAPSSWGMSIYLGYNWWWPSYYYRPYYYGYGYYSYGFDYGWGWGCHRPYWGGYWSGYNHGYYDGYYAGYYAGYYHNYLDNNRSYFHGHRNRIGSSNGIASNRNSRGEKPENYGNNASSTSNTTVQSLTPVSFNERFDQMIGTSSPYVVSSGNSNSSINSNTATETPDNSLSRPTSKEKPSPT
ncbi:MAG TPA: hypothetical protein PK548_07375, partial [Bacteroidales bacterium]|nr:hypothetical protein [Bacteroidales bacterium]